MWSTLVRNSHSYRAYTKDANKSLEVITALVTEWREKLHLAGWNRVGHLPNEDKETALY